MSTPKRPLPEAQASVELVKVLHDCYDYTCTVCQSTHPFYDQALDCVLSHRLDKPTQTKPQKQGGRQWGARRY